MKCEICGIDDRMDGSVYCHNCRTMKHTPGPWKVITLSNAKITGSWIGAQVIQDKDEGTVICDVLETIYDERREQEECLANAHLIKASPDLLAACEEASIVLQSLPDWEELHDIVGYTEEENQSRPLIGAALERLLNAIVKAKGNE